MVKLFVFLARELLRKKKPSMAHNGNGRKKKIIQIDNDFLVTVTSSNCKLKKARFYKFLFTLG